MSISFKKWDVYEADKFLSQRLSDELGQPSIVADLLIARGYADAEQAREFLDCDIEPHNPYLLHDMDKAVERIRNAIGGQEAVAIYGDYDCDGLTSTVMLHNYLESVGADVTYYIPDRETQGYGLNKESLLELKARGVSLIITVDNGMTAHDEIEFSNGLGMDVIVTDHHTQRGDLPKAVAVLNPHRLDCSYPFRHLAGVGVVFKLICALENDECGEEMLDIYGDLLCVGSIGDIVELTGENRRFVRYGLKRLADTQNAGLKALIKVSGLEGKEITSESVAYGIVPRINAAGRLGQLNKALELLFCEDDEMALSLAEEINRLNSERKRIEREILTNIDAKIKSSPKIIAERVIILFSEGWHSGVIGIVCSKLIERYGKPCILFSVSDGVAKGSARSIGGFSIIDMINKCSSRLLRYGGHNQAAGLSLLAENLEAFIAEFHLMTKKSCRIMPVSILKIDKELRLHEIGLGLAEAMSSLQPYGSGNKKPVFLLKSLKLLSIASLGDGNHIRLRLTDGNQETSIMYFGMSAQRFPYIAGDILDIVANIGVNIYNDKKSVSLSVKELRMSGINEDELICGRQLFDIYLLGEELSGEELRLIDTDRDDIAVVYRFLRSCKDFAHGADLMFCRLKSLNYFKLKMSLMILEELELISTESSGGIQTHRVLPNPKKVDIENSSAFRRLKGMTRASAVSIGASAPEVISS